MKQNNEIMATTQIQDEDFFNEIVSPKIEGIFPADFLEVITNWISLNLKPEDVFTKEQLKEWAKEFN